MQQFKEFSEKNLPLKATKKTHENQFFIHVDLLIMISSEIAFTLWSHFMISLNCC